MIVCKFGGSSMADAESIQRVANIVRSDDERRYVVVSAPGKRYADDVKVTDLLIYLYNARDTKNFKEVLNVLYERFFEIEKGLKIDVGLQAEFDGIEREIGGKNVDYAKSKGEYLSAKLLAKTLEIPFVDTKCLVKFKGETLDFDTTLANIRTVLKDVDRAVLPGFYGSDENDEIKTFSRGGSDITGALVAAAMRADAYENWTDVDGVFSADPRKDETATRFERLTYKEMYALACSGANVLHKDAVFPVEKFGIPLKIKNTFNPYCKGTLITL